MQQVGKTLAEWAAEASKHLEGRCGHCEGTHFIQNKNTGIWYCRNCRQRRVGTIAGNEAPGS